MRFIRIQIKQAHKNSNSTILLIKKFFKIPLFLFAIPLVLIIRLIKPLLLVRFGGLISGRIGHFIANTEMYLCERDACINLPNQRYIDIFFLGFEPVCNKQLVVMWKRVLRIWPSWILAPIYRINEVIPGGKIHTIEQAPIGALDVHNLLDRFPPHLQFTCEEELFGEIGLERMGLPAGAQFVCLIVRDSSYLETELPSHDWSYHNYRDSDIQNYILAAEALADRGYFVIRMGSRVHKSIRISHPKVIDYATNGMRSDFMDIYLAAKCAFCVTTGTGLDGVSEMFRRPMVYVNLVPIGGLHTFSSKFLSITKKHVWHLSQKTLSLLDIFSHGVGFCFTSLDYVSKGVVLIDNTPEEIRDVTIEMAERLAGIWKADPNDELLQKRFWKIFSINAVDTYKNKPLHGKIRARFGAMFLRNNKEWLQ